MEHVRTGVLELEAHSARIRIHIVGERVVSALMAVLFLTSNGIGGIVAV